MSGGESAEGGNRPKAGSRDCYLTQAGRNPS
jgi:hypothetical protein